MGAKIGPKSEKGGKKGVQKSMRKKDANLKVEKSPQVAKTLDPWSSEARFWGAGGFGGNGETGFDSDLL